MKTDKIIFDEVIRADHGVELRVFRPEDAAPLFAMVEQNRQYLKKWLSWVDYTKTVEDEIGFIESAIADREAKKAVSYGVYFEGQIAGTIGYYEITWAHEKAKIGYWLAESMQGKGTMTEACRALVNIGFKQFGLNRIEIRVAPQNEKSQAIPRRLNFKYEGVLRQDDKVGDKFNDSEVYGILKNEWK